MEDLVSLIVPVYNSEKWLEKFFHKFENQTYENIELVIVDDGSTDRTLMIADKYAKVNTNVSVYHKENGGPSSARNCGLNKAKGKYIAFVDVDDDFKPNYIKYLHDILCKSNADIAFCSYIKIPETKNYDIEKKVEHGEELVLSQDEAIQYFCYRKKLTGYSCLKLIRTDIAKTILFPEDIVYGEDFIFTYELLKKCNTVVYGNQIEYIYIQYKDSATHIKRDNTEKYRIAWKKHIDFLNDVKINYPKSYGGAVAKCYILAINNTTRIYDKKRDKDVLEQYYEFIGENAKSVWLDTECKMLNRILGFLGCVSVKGVCLLSQCFFKLQELFDFSLKRTV